MIVPDRSDVAYLNPSFRLEVVDQWWCPVDPPLPFKTNFWGDGGTNLPDESDDGRNFGAWEMLRSLAQTCRTLRAIALPVLWSVCQIDQMAQLGQVREVLRASPYLAHHVRDFSIAWSAPDADVLDASADEAGTLLELAFGSDRWNLWDDLAKQHGCKVHLAQGEDRSFFVLHGKRYFEPGYALGNQEHSPENLPQHARLETVGPDGRGEDRFIKSAEQFNQCIVEVVAQLSSLESFRWDAAGVSMPRGVFDALLKLDGLRNLCLDMEPIRRGVQMREFIDWSLVRLRPALQLDAP